MSQIYVPYIRWQQRFIIIIIIIIIIIKLNEG
jgi:hypothetical protein